VLTIPDDRRFTFSARIPRVVFGAGTRTELPRELQRLGIERAFLVTTPGRAAMASELASLCTPLACGVFDAARQHVPASVLELARSAALRAGADAYVSLGGGAATGVAKALALESELPIVALPTTFAGSEVTPVWGVTKGEEKLTGRSERVVPRVVIYDPELVLSLPPQSAGASGMNAVAHCVEALYAEDVNPLTSLVAEEGIRTMARALPQIAGAPEAAEPRSAALYGSFLAGLTLATVSMGPHHRLCHVLGGAFDLPHAGTHAVLLPYVAARLERMTPALARVASLLGGTSASVVLRELGARSLAPQSLRELGMREEDVDRACELAKRAFGGETPLAAADASRIVREAFTGEVPGSSLSAASAGR
jgi:maleylacetate reductase